MPRPDPRRYRDCDCPHAFLLCACHEGLTGVRLLNRSRELSSFAGWPSPNIDQAYVAEHQERVREAREGQAAEEQAAPAKPRVPLGFDQRSLPPPGCGTCQ